VVIHVMHGHRHHQASRSGTNSANHRFGEVSWPPRAICWIAANYSCTRCASDCPAWTRANRADRRTWSAPEPPANAPAAPYH